MTARNSLIIGAVFILFAAILLCGCTQQPAAPVQTPVATTAPTVGMANPASVYCEQIGGTVEILKNPDGSEYGMCNFPNTTSCEEWALYRGEGCKA
jgi:putative hemolysin